jgi:hypothetical protein
MAFSSRASSFVPAPPPKDRNVVVESKSLPRGFGFSGQDTPLDEAAQYQKLDPPRVKDWPTQPRRLSRSSSQILFNICIDSISLLVPLPFLILAGSIALRDGKNVVDNDWRYLQYLIQLVRYLSLDLANH